MKETSVNVYLPNKINILNCKRPVVVLLGLPVYEDSCDINCPQWLCVPLPGTTLSILLIGRAGGAFRHTPITMVAPAGFPSMEDYNILPTQDYKYTFFS